MASYVNLSQNVNKNFVRNNKYYIAEFIKSYLKSQEMNNKNKINNYLLNNNSVKNINQNNFKNKMIGKKRKPNPYNYFENINNLKSAKSNNFNLQQNRNFLNNKKINIFKLYQLEKYVSFNCIKKNAPNYSNNAFIPCISLL